MAAVAGGMADGALSNSSTGTVTNITTNSIQAISEWISKINPHYGNPFFPQSNVNCGSCALAVEQRLNGDTTAKADLSTELGTDAAMEQATGKTCTYMQVNDIADKLKKMGPGSHLIVGINRRLPDGSRVAGHWFNAFYDGQKIYTLDGQLGQILEWPYDYGYISEWCALV